MTPAVAPPGSLTKCLTDLIRLFYTVIMNDKRIIPDEETARQLGLSGADDGPRFAVLDEEVAKQLELKCFFCGSKKPVYAITKGLGPAFPRGAYCYKCLLTRCKATRCIPYPIPGELLDKIKRDMGLPITAIPTRFRV